MPLLNDILRITNTKQPWLSPTSPFTIAISRRVPSNSRKDLQYLTSFYSATKIWKLFCEESYLHYKHQYFYADLFVARYECVSHASQAVVEGVVSWDPPGVVHGGGHPHVGV